MKKRNRAAKLLRLKLISLAVAYCFSADLAFANPTGPVVANGQVSIIQNGNLLQITNSPNSIINWQSFSIGTSEITRFLQQSNSSAVLNRVITQNPSAILGALQSNGRVFLINPNGILFGAGAQVDVAGLVASSLNLSDTDFLAGRLRFTEVPGAGSVINQGAINAASGGHVYLVGPAVTNSGVITTPKGEVILAAGNSVELVDPGTPNLRVEITAPDNQAINLGQIVADSGRVGIYAGLINHSGTIRADSAVLTEDGRIVLKATKNAILEAGSVTTANGPNGGSITVQSDDTTLVSGTIEAKGLGSPQGGSSPTSSPPPQGEGEGGGGVGKGGTVQVLGNLVGLIDSASINASGETGGGTVLVGGDFQGKNPDIQNASATYIGPNAMITADAVTSGDGGKVIVWSDEATRAYGTITAQGGAQSGNGGFVEVSGKNWLDFAARVDTTAPSGATGTLLLDPTTTTISNAPTFGGACPPVGPCFVLAGAPDTANLNVFELIGALGTTNVTVSTSSGGGGIGDINVAFPIVYSSPHALTLHAVRDLNMVNFANGIFSSGTGALTLEAGRNFNLQDNSVLAPASSLTITAGNLNVTGVTQPTFIQSSTLDVNVSGGLRVLAGTAPNTRASVSSLNGQTINAGFIEVVAQGNNVTDISNFVSGNQVITTSGANMSGEGIVVRSLGGAGALAGILQSGAGPQVITAGGGLIVQSSSSGSAQITASGGQTIDAGFIEVTAQGGNSAFITNFGSGNQEITTHGANAMGEGIAVRNLGGGVSLALIDQRASAGAQQLITANNAGHVRVIGESGTAWINTLSGITQTVVLQGNRLNALEVGSATATGSSFISGGDQAITAGLPGQRGSIALHGAASGTGGSARLSATGGQAITASGIALTGGSGSGNFAEIRQFGLGSSQTITINNGGTLSMQGGLGGADNFAQIRGDGVSQTLVVQGGAIDLTGGNGPGTAAPGDMINNFARIQGSGSQTINSGSIALNGGLSGVNNFTILNAPNQLITTSGDVTLYGGPAANSGARIGGGVGAVPGPTNLTLNAGGDLLLQGGSNPNTAAVIGNTGTVPPQPTNIGITAGGDVILNAGSGAGARIGSGSNDLAVGGGDISISAGGSIELNGSSTQMARIRTLGNVQLHADSPGGTISEIPNGLIQANALTTTSNAGTSLTGPNQVAVFNATNTASGDVIFNNTSPLLTVTGISQVPSGAFTLTQNGDLSVTGNVFSGPQSISATGDMVVGADTNSVTLYAAGPQAINASGEPNASPRALGVGLLDRVAGHGPVNITARSLSVQGGSNIGSFAAITGGPINVTTTGNIGTGDFGIAGGSGLGAFGWVLSSQNIDLTIGGSLMLNSGTGFGSFARMQAVHPTSLINVYFPNLSEGGYFVNGVEGAYRNGLTGFFTGPVAAKPGTRLITTYGEE